MKKQMATILGNMAYEIKQCGHKDPALGLAIKQATLQICQKFHKTVDNPDGYEPKPDICKDCQTFYKGCEGSNQEDCVRRSKPDEGRLLNRDSFEELTFGDKVWGMIEPMLQAQDTETASIIRAENQELRNEERRYFEAKTTEAKEFVREECRGRVEGIFKEIEDSIWFKQPSWPKESFMDWWQSLKEGVK